MRLTVLSILLCLIAGVAIAQSLGFGMGTSEVRGKGGGTGPVGDYLLIDTGSTLLIDTGSGFLIQ